jgi:hypothetical protein
MTLSYELLRAARVAGADVVGFGRAIIGAPL